jgi:hypothetical protein
LAVLVNVINPQSTAAMNYLAAATSAPTIPLPHVTRAVDGWSTGVMVHNPNGVPAVARVVYYDAGGAERAREEDSVAAGATRSYFQQRQAALPDGFVGSAVVQSVSGVPLVAVVSEVYTP